MKTFKDLFKALEDIEAVRKICEEGTEDYEKWKGETVGMLDAISDRLTETTQTHKLEESDSEEDKKEKEEAILSTLEKTRDALYEIQGIRDKMRNFTEKAIEENITKVTNDLLPYKAFRKKLERELVETKVAIVTASVRLGTHIRDAKVGVFETSNSQKETLENILAFIDEMKSLNFYRLTSDQKNRILKSFNDAAKTYTLGVGNHAKRGLYTEFSSELETLLNDGLDFSVYSEKCWAACELREKQLVEDNYIRQMQERIGMMDFYSTYVLKRGTIRRYVRTLEFNLMQFGSEKSQKAMQGIRANKIPPQIQWLKEAYGLGKWTYENLGAQIGASIDLPQEAPFKFKVATPETEASLDVPVCSLYGLADIGFEFGASVEAALSFNGKLTLANFLDVTEDDYVTGEINASAAATAEAFAGVFIKLVQLIKASGRIVASAEAKIAAKGEAALSKANIESIAKFKIGASGSIGFILEGHLEARLGLTPIISTLIHLVTGKKPVAKVKSPSLDFFKAERKATINFEMPLKEKPYDLPKDSLKLSAGEWELTFIAKDTLTAFWKDTIGGRKKWKEVDSKTAIHKKDLEIIQEQFATLGQQTT